MSKPKDIENILRANAETCLRETDVVGLAQVLYPVICELRSIKTDMELEVLGFIAKVSSMAHKHVMRSIKPGMKVSLASTRFF
jgi:Xaa-Pro aminopeptidase